MRFSDLAVFFRGRARNLEDKTCLISFHIVVAEYIIVINPAAKLRRPRDYFNNSSYIGQVAKHKMAAQRIANVNGRNTNPQPTMISPMRANPAICSILC
jgi:hypothetical protein